MLVNPLLRLYREKNKSFGKWFSLFLFLIDFFPCVLFYIFITMSYEMVKIIITFGFFFHKATKILNENPFIWNFDISV